ncbi:MAG: hypothetical protein ACI840_000764 [Ulvibacter sp.]
MKTIYLNNLGEIEDVRLPNVAEGLYFVQLTSNKQTIVKKVQVK